MFGPALKQPCLDYVEENWTDMRPLSLQKEMAKLEAERKEKEQKERASPKKIAKKK